MVVHLFAVKSSQNCALLHTAEANSSDFSSVVLDTIRRNVYVDNCLNSMNSEIKATGLMNELIMPLRRGRFELSKWLTNCLVVSFHLSVSCVESSVILGLDYEETLSRS